MISLLFASRFIEDNVSYTDADYAMTNIWSHMVDYVMREDIVFPEPALTIYNAFDQGEYDHGDDRNPIDKYTMRSLEKVQKRHNKVVKAATKHQHTN